MGGMSERERERESGLPLPLLSADIFTNMSWGWGGGEEEVEVWGSEKGREGMLEKWKKGAYRRSMTVGKGEGVHGCRKEGIQREIVKGGEEEVEQKC